MGLLWHMMVELATTTDEYRMQNGSEYGETKPPESNMASLADVMSGTIPVDAEQDHHWFHSNEPIQSNPLFGNTSITSKKRNDSIPRHRNDRIHSFQRGIDMEQNRTSRLENRMLWRKNRRQTLLQQKSANTMRVLSATKEKALTLQWQLESNESMNAMNREDGERESQQRNDTESTERCSSSEDALLEYRNLTEIEFDSLTPESGVIPYLSDSEISSSLSSTPSDVEFILITDDDEEY